MRLYLGAGNNSKYQYDVVVRIITAIMVIVTASGCDNHNNKLQPSL